MKKVEYFDPNIAGDHTPVSDEQGRFVKREDYDKLRTAVEWVLTDAAYKPPELVGDVAERWIWKLRETLGCDLA
jgi:hypothetical protein